MEAREVHSSMVTDSEAEAGEASACMSQVLPLLAGYD